jgi:hypothetical protein
MFLDTHGNGRYDPGERGVAGCIVSDEHTIVLTDTEGRYRLDTPDAVVTVFVVNAPATWPGGPWWATLPDGRAEQNFALRPQDRPEPLCFVHGTDIHLDLKTVGPADRPTHRATAGGSTSSGSALFRPGRDPSVLRARA